jgi:YHS domain-containing protein
MTGNPIDKQFYADHNGKRIYFCSKACVDAFNKEPEKYMKAMEEKGIKLEDAPKMPAGGTTPPEGGTTPPEGGAMPPEGTPAVKMQTHCPILTDNLINKDIFVDHNGKRIYFCCIACPATFNEDPEKYIKQMEDAGITLDKTPEPETPANP